MMKEFLKLMKRERKMTGREKSLTIQPLVDDSEKKKDLAQQMNNHRLDTRFNTLKVRLALIPHKARVPLRVARVELFYLLVNLHVPRDCRVFPS